MILILTKKANPDQIKEVAQELKGYIKFVVDLEKGILAAGGEMHVDCEKVLLDGGSSQNNLWGGGLDLESGEMDFNSMINLRPLQKNSSRDVLDAEIRERMTQIAAKILE